MESVSQFCLRHDVAAIAALERAGRCARFDDYLMRNVRSRLTLLQRLRATGWEDDANEMFGALLPHLARLNYASTAIMDRARVARKSGDEKRALELVGILQRAGASLARSDDLYLTRRVGENIVVRAWKFALEDQTNLPVEPKDNDFLPSPATAEALANYQQQMVTRFETYARAHGRSDLARQAQNIAARFNAHKAMALYKTGAVPNPLQSITRLGKLSWLASVALFLGAIGSATWLLSWPLSRRDKDAPARRGALQSAMFVAGVTAVTLVGLLILVPGVANSPYSYDDTKATPTDALLWLSENYLLFLLALWLAPALVPLLWRLVSLLRGINFAYFKRDNKMNWLQIARALLIAGFVVGGAGVGITLGTHQSVDSILGQMFLVFMALWLGSALVGTLLMLALLRGQKRALAFCLTGAFWSWSIWLSLGAPGTDETFYGSIAGAIALVMGIAALFLAGRIWNLSLPYAQIQDFAFQFAARARSAAGVLTLLSAIAYLGITLWTIPVENQTRAMMQRQLQIGEVAWLREQRK